MMPAWAISAMLTFCPIHGGPCGQQHLQGIAIAKSACSKTERGWVDGVGEVRITVRCAK